MRNLIIPILFSALAAGVLSMSFGNSEENSIEEAITSIEDENFFYFYDTALNGRDNASDFCKAADPLGELAIITGKRIYDRLRLGDFPPAGSYWINGMDKDDVNRFNAITTVCEDHKSLWSLEDVPVTLPTTYCLALMKNESSLLSRIEATDCNAQLRSLCTLPVNTWRNPITTTTTTPPTTLPSSVAP